ncbi:MAG TPA: hypothetical protein VJC03_06060 [bacterium]|nr:hypothetical protein [bacterium]
MKCKIRTLFSFAFLFLLAAGLQSATPQKINYQGRLEESGSPVTADSLPVNFKIYDALTSGSELWESGNQLLAVTNGLFNYALDFSQDPVDWNSGDKYLEIVINGTALTPRELIISSAYSLNADKLDGLSSESFLLASGGTMTGGLNLAGYALLTSSSITGVKRIIFNDGTSQTTAASTDNLGNHTATQPLQMGNYSLLTSSAILGVKKIRFDDSTEQTTAASTDNLGNHTATQKLQMGGYAILTSSSVTGLKQITWNGGTTQTNNSIDSSGALNLNSDTVYDLTLNDGNPGDVLIAGGGGKVGIGTPSPSSTMTVAGVIESTAGGFKFPDGTTQASAASSAYTILAFSPKVSINMSETAYILNYSDSVETAAQQVMPRDGTVKNLYVMVSGNTTTTSFTVVTIRKNELDTLVTLTIPWGQTGTFVNATNTASFLSGDKLSIRVYNGSATGVTTISTITMEY